MNLRDLRYLVSVAEHLHFGRAALACHVSQPTLSMQIKKLEDTLGIQLFERTNKHVMPTAMGHEMIVRARRVLEETQHMVALAKNARDPLTGHVRIGIFPTLAPYLLPSLMPHLRARFPKLSPLLVEEKTPVLLGQLDAGALDCALLAMPVAQAGLEARSLLHEPFMLATSPTHRLAKRKTVTFDDLKHESILLLEDGHCLRDQALAVCARIGVGETNDFRATSLETLRHMVASSEAVTFMPRLAARADSSAARYIPFAAPAPAREVGLYWRATSARAPLFNAMADLIAARYKTI